MSHARTPCALALTGMGHPSDMLPPAARAALPSVQEAPAAAAALGLAGGVAAPAPMPLDVDTRDGAVRYAAYAGRTAQIMQRVRMRNGD